MAFARTSDGSNVQNHRYLWLDAARGMAAIVVMLYHFQEYLGTSMLFRFGYLAVDLFFMMSGFVLAHAYGAKLRDGMTSLQFTVSRLIRLYPVYLLATVLGASYYLSKIILDTNDAPDLLGIISILLQNLFFLPILNGIAEPKGMFPFSPASWSLSLEVILSLTFGIALWNLRTSVLFIAFLFMSAICAFFVVKFGTLDFGFSIDGFFPAMFRAMAEFLLGVWLYRTFHSWRVETSRAPLTLLIAISSTLLFVPPNLTLGVVIVLVVFPLFMVLQPMREPTGKAALIFSGLGRLSYPIYLIHTPILLWGVGFAKFLGKEPQYLTPWLGIALALTTIVISWAVVIFFDEPVRRWLNAMVRRSRIPFHPLPS